MTRAKAQRPPLDPTIKLSDAEALLALVIDHHDRQIETLRCALGAVLIELGARSRDRSSLGEALRTLYPETIGPAGTENCQAPTSPFPTHWLKEMARSGRSLAQVARGWDLPERLRAAVQH